MLGQQKATGILVTSLPLSFLHVGIIWDPLNFVSSFLSFLYPWCKYKTSVFSLVLKNCVFLGKVLTLEQNTENECNDSCVSFPWAPVWSHHRLEMVIAVCKLENA